VNIKARFKTVDQEIETAGDDSRRRVSRLKEILTSWLRIEEAKPSRPLTFYHPRCARQAVVRRLWTLGLGAKAICRLAGYPHCTVAKDIRQLEGATTSVGLLAEPAKIYRAVLSEYTKLRYHQGFIEETIEDTGWYLGLLERYLGVSEIRAYLLGVEMVCVSLRLLRPGRKTSPTSGCGGPCVRKRLRSSTTSSQSVSLR
jgi:hypothetical protein